jgi:hypothetical protein
VPTGDVSLDCALTCTPEPAKNLILSKIHVVVPNRDVDTDSDVRVVDERREDQLLHRSQ